MGVDVRPRAGSDRSARAVGASMRLKAYNLSVFRRGVVGYCFIAPCGLCLPCLQATSGVAGAKRALMERERCSQTGPCCFGRLEWER